MDVRLMREALSECSIEVDTRVAADGVAALELISKGAEQQPSWQPDLIICDLNMPRMDGHAFLAVVKSDTATRHIPVIMLSSSSAPRDVARAYALHANCFVRKPVAFDELCVLAKRIGDFWITTVELPSQVDLPRVESA
jgi:CheY-like chemotaxis protein